MSSPGTAPILGSARSRLILRVIFWLYAAALFVGTHIPEFKVQVEGFERPDVLIHITSFGIWMALLGLTGYTGRVGTVRSIVIAAMIAILYAGVDEGLQAIPAVRRTAAWDDYAANVFGIVSAATLLALGSGVGTGRRKDGHHDGGFHGPRCWLASAIVGLLLGFVLSVAAPPATVSAPVVARSSVQVIEIRPDGSRHERHADEDAAHASPAIPLAICIPFVMLLLSIAVMPFVSEPFWHKHYPDFAFLLGALVLAYYLTACGGFGRHAMLHAGIEYYSFIALVGGLYVASGGILVDIRDRGTARTNTLLLACGAIAANIVGTTGASVLFIRPFMRMNRGRLRPIHVVFFIFIVSNCGGCLTPIGDPPLYLGYLRGVPFAWTITHLWPMWLLVNGLLLAVFFVIDSRVPAAAPHVYAHDAPRPTEVRSRLFDPSHRTPLIVGGQAVFWLVLLVAGVFIDPGLKAMGLTAVEGMPVGATIQLIVAALAYALASPSIRHANAFTFAPVKEVGFLFVGIFATMVPALGYLSAHGSRIGLESPTHFYFGTGALSAVLDNAPTYISFLQVAFGVLHLPLDQTGIAEFIRNKYDIAHASGLHLRFEGQLLLEAVSLGAVFFGAMTYIGNGPNFMVKSIVESSKDGVRMPSFSAYVLYAAAILGPVLLVNWLVFIR